MFCQKCGKPVPDGEGKIIGNHLVCEECAQSLVKHFCQRCGKELPRGTQPQENGRLLCEACAALPDDSGADEPFRDSRKKQPAGLPMLPVWMSALILVLVAGAVGMLFATKTLCFHKWQPATCQQPEICLRCGRIHGEPLPHRWKDADCLHPRTCMLCGETEGEPLGHDWLDATCTEPQICTRCGATQGKPAGHKWEKANCQHPEQCLVCGAVRGERGDHVWREATCEEPRTCELCGETEGEPLGHDWVDADCTHPKTCAVCGVTEGEALGHQWLPATIAAPKTCKVCGETEGKPLDLRSLLPVDLMNVTKSDFIEATGDARHEKNGCTACANRSSTLVSDLFPGCVLAFGSADDAKPDHIHVFSGKVTADTSVGMNYKKLSDTLGTPSWSINESDMTATASYTIGGVKVGYVFTDKRILNDIIISQIAGREKVSIHYPDTKVASARIG